MLEEVSERHFDHGAHHRQKGTSGIVLLILHECCLCVYIVCVTHTRVCVCFRKGGHVSPCAQDDMCVRARVCVCEPAKCVTPELQTYTRCENMSARNEQRTDASFPPPAQVPRNEQGACHLSLPPRLTPELQTYTRCENMSARNEQRIVKRLGRSWEKRGGVETQVFRGLHKGKM